MSTIFEATFGGNKISVTKTKFGSTVLHTYRGVTVNETQNVGVDFAIDLAMNQLRGAIETSRATLTQSLHKEEQLVKGEGK